MWKFLLGLIISLQIAYGSEIKCKKSSGTALKCEFTDITTSTTNNHKLSIPSIPSAVPAENVEVVIINAGEDEQDEYDDEPVVEKPKIEQFPFEIFTLFPNVRELEVRLAIKSLSPDDLAFATKLEKLNLNKNAIETIDDRTFANQSRLNELSLSDNKLKTIKENTFTGLNELRVLNLRSNEISTIEDNAFDLPKLEKLNLDYNRVKSVPVDFPNRMPALNTFTLGSNPEHSERNEVDNLDLVKFSKLQQLKQLKFSIVKINLKNVQLTDTSGSSSALEKLAIWGIGLMDAADLEVLHKLFPQLKTLELDHNGELRNFDLDKEVIRNWWPKLTSISLFGSGVDRAECQRKQSDFYETHQIRLACGWS